MTGDHCGSEEGDGGSLPAVLTGQEGGCVLIEGGGGGGGRGRIIVSSL